MLKRYTFWLWTAVVFLLLAGALHSISFLISPTGQTETERQMLALMTSYKMDMPGGYHPTMWNLFTALSACFTFVCLLGGLTIAFLLKKKVPVDVLKGAVAIHLLIFAACFVVDAIFTFVLPIRAYWTGRSVPGDWASNDSESEASLISN